MRKSLWRWIINIKKLKPWSFRKGSEFLMLKTRDRKSSVQCSFEYKPNCTDIGLKIYKPNCTDVSLQNSQTDQFEFKTALHRSLYVTPMFVKIDVTFYWSNIKSRNQNIKKV